jgi:hypothetical protein
MANTYTLISSVTVGSGGASSIDFTAIPQTYTDLLVKISARNDSGGNLFVTFNSSSASFARRDLFANVPTVGSSNSADNFIGASNDSTFTANTFSNSELYIPNYTGSTNKSYSSDTLNENNASVSNLRLLAGLWSNTSAITALSLNAGAGNNFVQYTTAYLYGISNA